MITHRVTTKVTPEPPVKFYRTIAVSFLVLTLILLGIIIFFTSKSASIVIVSKTDNKNIDLNVNVEQLKTSDLSVVGMVTSTLLGLSEKYFPTGNKIVDGIATGEATLYNETGLSQTLVKTTRLMTSDGILFRLTDKVVVPANGQVTASVYADQAGASGNIGPSKFTIPGLSADKQKVIYAESTQTMSGGVRKEGILTDEDLKSADNDYVEKVKQAVAQSLASSSLYDQNLISVASHNVSADHKAGDDITEFNLTGTSTVVIVYYKQADLKSLLEKEISNHIDLSTEKILSLTKDPQVSLASYDLIKGTAQLSIYQDVLVTLDANASKLAAENFTGKSKDDIERYVLGLPHVVGVDVKMSPSWLGNTPGVSDKIKVIVKNVE